MTGTAVTTYEDRWAQEAKAVAAAEPLSAGTWLSTKGGQLTIGESVLPGAQAAVIVLDSVRENTYYGARYDADNPMPPVCYALARDTDTLFPHLDMQKDLGWFRPQHIRDGQVAGCEGCPMNEWGSADQGKGKACQNRRRLTVVPAGFYTPKRGSRDFNLELFDDPAHFQTAEVAYFKLPVTSVANWSKYVNQVAQNIRRPYYGVVTRLHVEPDAKTQYSVQFEMIDAIPDSLAEIVMRRNDNERNRPLTGYAPPDAEKLAGGGRQGGFRR